MIRQRLNYRFSLRQELITPHLSHLHQERDGRKVPYAALVVKDLDYRHVQ